MIKTVQIIVSGRVQGVGFRWATKSVAEKLGVKGLVTNLLNGHVKIIAQADQKTLKRFISVIKASPTPYGFVSNLKVKTIRNGNYQIFTVK